MSERPATMNVNGKPTRCTALEAYGKGGLNYRVRFEEDCALGKAGKVYIAPSRLLTFAQTAVRVARQATGEEAIPTEEKT